MRRSTFAFLIVIALAGCGGGLSGTYADDMGAVTYEFQSNGKVLITSGFGAAVELEYKKDGDKIRIGTPEGAQVLTITEEGHIDMGFILLKKQD